MSKSNRKEFSADAISAAIRDGKTMGRAAQLLNVDWRTFKRRADELGMYAPGSSGRTKFELSDILAGLHPQYPTSKLAKRLVEEGYKVYKCECCGIAEWMSKPISLELNHIDGDNSNHALGNLELLCPNCHSQTPTYRSKKLKWVKEQENCNEIVV